MVESNGCTLTPPINPLHRPNAWVWGLFVVCQPREHPELMRLCRVDSPDSACEPLRAQGGARVAVAYREQRVATHPPAHPLSLSTSQ